MEFSEKLQKLRKQRGLTQEELAEALFVSRTAISKWESGRGLPSIDSLQAISRYFSVSIDVLLSTDEVLTIATEDRRQQGEHFRDAAFGLLDCSAALLLILPLFTMPAGEGAAAVSLPALTGMSAYLVAAFYAIVLLPVLLGLASLALQRSGHPLWTKNRRRLSMLLNAAGLLLFIISRQPYAAIFAFFTLTIKAWMLLKQR